MQNIMCWGEMWAGRVSWHWVLVAFEGCSASVRLWWWSSQRFNWSSSCVCVCVSDEQVSAVWPDLSASHTLLVPAREGTGLHQLNSRLTTNTRLSSITERLAEERVSSKRSFLQYLSSSHTRHTLFTIQSVPLGENTLLSRSVCACSTFLNQTQMKHVSETSVSGTLVAQLSGCV